MPPMKSSSRNGAAVRLLALHTTEGAMTNVSLRNFFSRADAAGSSHASADRTGFVDVGFVPYDRAAWTLRSGNAISDNLEICGFAKWTRDEWMVREHERLVAAARWLAFRSMARSIPLRTLTHRQIQDGQSGVIQHNDWTQAMKDGSHWDCGPGFPIEYVLEMARGIIAGERQQTKATRQADPIMQNFPLGAGHGQFTVLCPIADNSALYQKAWLSFISTNADATFKVWFQSDKAGVSDHDVVSRIAHGRAQRFWLDWPAGAVQAVIRYHAPMGGTVLLEVQPK